MIKAPKLADLLSKIQHLSRREKLVFYGALIFVSLALADSLIVRTFYGVLGGLDKKIQDKETQIKAGLRVMGQKERIELQHTNYKSYLGGAKTENEEFTSILKALDTLAPVQPGFNLIDMKPAGIKETTAAKKYLVTLNCEGTMEKIVEFMYNIETSDKLLTVEKYEVTPKSRDTSLAKCSLTISDLVLP
jgi:hypothetical protein